MTLPDVSETMPQPAQKEDKVAKLLAKVLMKAKNDGRITSGVFECTKVLEMDPDQVFLCVLPETSADDVLTSIQHKLINAYCLENDVHTLRVDSSEKLSSLINSSNSSQMTANKNPVTMPTFDCSCVLIGHPGKGKKNVLENTLIDEIWPNQLVNLPS